MGLVAALLLTLMSHPKDRASVSLCCVTNQPKGLQLKMPVYSSLIQWVGSLGLVQLVALQLLSFVLVCVVTPGGSPGAGRCGMASLTSLAVGRLGCLRSLLCGSHSGLAWTHFCGGCRVARKSKKGQASPSAQPFFKSLPVSCLPIFYWPQKVIWSSPDSKHTELESIC